MKKTKTTTLALRSETIRTLAGIVLLGVVGAREVTSSGPDQCPPATPHPSCTGCASINRPCATEGCPGTDGTCAGCTLVTF